MSEEKIVEEINKYINNNKINYAILIDGEWGSGKTYFIKNNIIKPLEKEHKNFKEKHKPKPILGNKKKNYTNKKPVYVSLYGINSVSEIKNKIIMSQIENEKNKKIMPIIDLGIGIGNEIINKKTLISNSSDKLLKHLYKLEHIIIFFDDLERCSLNINIVLGYINELVEHNNVKVILIADEEKIGKLNYNEHLELKYIATQNNLVYYETEPNKTVRNFGKTQQNKLTIDEIKERADKLFGVNMHYNEIKEKLIGKTIYYKPNLDKVYASLANYIIDNKEIANIVLNKQKNLVKIFEKKNYFNLRTLQFIFQTYETLAKISIDNVDLNEHREKYLTELFEYCTFKSLQIKQGQNSYNWEEKEFGTIYLGNELKDYIYKNFIKGFKFVDDYLLYSYIDELQIKNIVKEYILLENIENKNPNDPLYKLREYWLISEQRIKKLIDDIDLKIERNEYALDLYPQIIMTLTGILDMGIRKTKIPKVIEKLEENIRTKNVDGDLPQRIQNIQASEKVTILYNESIEKIKKLVNNKKENNKIIVIKKILSEEDWGFKFKEFCYENMAHIISDNKFAYLLDPNLISQNIINKDIENIWEFHYGLSEVYSMSNIIVFSKNEKEYLTKLKNELNNINKVDRVKKHILNIINTDLEIIIQKLTE